MPSTFRKFIETCSPSLVREKYNTVLTIKDAVKVNAPRLGMAVNKYGSTKMKGYIKLWLIDLNMMSGVSRPLNEAQLDFTANSIINKYRELSIADINLIFNNAIEGKYGQFYESLAPPKILSWFDEYLSVRMEICESMSFENHLSNKDNPDYNRGSEITVKQLFKK